LFDVRLPESDLKKIETCRFISEVYVRCIVDTYALVDITILSNARKRIQLRQGIQFAVRSVKFT